MADKEKAEKVLHKGEEYFRAITENSSDIIIIVDSKGDITYTSPSIQRFCGYEPEDLIGKSGFVFIHPADLPRAIKDFSQAIRSADVIIPNFFRVRHKDGSQRILEGVGKNLLVNPAVRGFVMNVRDVTERKKADGALKESEERFRLLAENATDIIWTMNMDLRFTYVSPSVTRQRGYGVEEAMEQTIEEILTPDSYKLAREVFKEELMREKKKQNDLTRSRMLELEHRCKDGSTILCELSVNFLRDIKGKAIGILGVTRDITERKRVEEEYRMILSTSIDGFWITDAQGRFLDVNDAYCRLIGYGREELLKMRISDIEAAESSEETAKRIQKIMAAGGDRFETRHRRKDGKIIDVEISVNYTKEGGRRLFVFSRDISGRKKAQEELEKAYRNLKETQEELVQSSKMAAMGHLAAGISHELTQPLTGIKGFAQARVMNLDKKNPLGNDLRKIIEQADRMNEIIKNVRLFARKSNFKMDKLNINKPINDSLILLSQQLKLRNIVLKKSLANNLPKIKGDSNQLEQVFINLITNARDAIDSLNTARGGELIIKTSLSDDKKNIEITFQDTGCGISKENLGHVFNPFFTTKSPFKGMGLGSAVAYRIIENHKGKMTVESQEGKGTCFRIILPAVKEFTPPQRKLRV
jgi:PAS domain S-box-containing protein